MKMFGVQLRQKQDVAVLSPETMRLTKVMDNVQAYYQNAQAGRSANVMNGLSGAGGGSDKSMFFQMMPYWFNSRTFIENTTIQSWVADRFIGMPVDDMFTRPREYDDDAFHEESDRLNVNQRIADTMKLGRKYGTGLIWAVTREADPSEPLEVERIRPDDLRNLIVLDKNDAWVLSTDDDIYSENFGRPLMYMLSIRGVGSVQVHASRIYRFDGMTPNSSNGWISYDRNWGISNLAHAMTDIFNDASVVQAVSHLVQEASIPVHKVKGLAEIMCSDPLPDEPSTDQMMQQLNMYKSIYRTVLTDSENTFERMDVNFSNIPDLLEKFSDRLAMMAGISATRFLGKSPDGMNATGEGDIRNDNRTTSARQHHLLAPCYKWLDEIVARSAGTVVPEYTFPPLFESTEEEKAKTTDKRAETVVRMTGSSVWDEEEGKHYVATGMVPTGVVTAEAGEDD